MIRGLVMAYALLAPFYVMSRKCMNTIVFSTLSGVTTFPRPACGINSMLTLAPLGVPLVASLRHGLVYFYVEPFKTRSSRS